MKHVLSIKLICSLVTIKSKFENNNNVNTKDFFLVSFWIVLLYYMFACQSEFGSHFYFKKSKIQYNIILKRNIFGMKY